MDTSEIYIKMCEKAKKYIKSSWRHGQPFFNTDTQKIEYACPLIMNVPRVADTILWYQDQLQEMVLNGWVGRKPYWLEHKFHEFLNKNVKDIYSSLEQLWLAFVMKEKFNKVWDKEDWREITT